MDLRATTAEGHTRCHRGIQEDGTQNTVGIPLQRLPDNKRRLGFRSEKGTLQCSSAHVFRNLTCHILQFLYRSGCNENDSATILISNNVHGCSLNCPQSARKAASLPTCIALPMKKAFCNAKCKRVAKPLER